MSQHVVHHMYVVPRLTISITINVSLKIEKNSSMNKRHRGARILAFVQLNRVGRGSRLVKPPGRREAMRG